jgi:hypothetical protein
VLEEVAAQAEKEHGLKAALASMRKEWDAVSGRNGECHLHTSRESCWRCDVCAIACRRSYDPFLPCPPLQTVFELLPYKSTGTFVLRGTDDVNALLDDQLVKTQVRSGES